MNTSCFNKYFPYFITAPSSADAYMGVLGLCKYVRLLKKKHLLWYA